MRPKCWLAGLRFQLSAVTQKVHAPIALTTSLAGCLILWLIGRCRQFERWGDALNLALALG